MSQLEASVPLTSPFLVEFVANGRIPGRTGNRHPSAPPQGCYRCPDEDRWVAITVWDDAEWRRYWAVLGRPELAAAGVVRRGLRQPEEETPWNCQA